MDDHEMLETLEDLATRLGIQVRHEPAGGQSGSGMLHGKRIAVIDAGLSLRERVEALAAILAEQDHEGLFLPPVVRELLEDPRP